MLFRSKVYNLWASCQAAATDAIDNPGKAFMAGKFIMLKVQNKALWMKLPSGRLICWRDPKIEDHLTPWGDMRTGVTVFNQNTYSRSWERNVLIGSSIFQSAVQATARDFLANAMLNLEKAGYELINSIHDEVLLLVDEESGESAMDDVIRIMTTPPEWAPDFPLAAEGWYGKRYRK